MSKRRNLHELHSAILAAAKDGRGLHLSPPEVELLAKQPFVELDPRLLALEWRQIPGFERYEISEYGHVRRGMRVLKQTEHKSKHLSVTVYSAGGEQWRVGVHHLIALAFHGPRSMSKPYACHRNGRAWENHKDNIYWGSREENVADMVRHASLDRRVNGESVETGA
jgi:NUMOD4 motif